MTKYTLVANSGSLLVVPRTIHLSPFSHCPRTLSSTKNGTLNPGQMIRKCRDAQTPRLPLRIPARQCDQAPKIETRLANAWMSLDQGSTSFKSCPQCLETSWVQAGILLLQLAIESSCRHFCHGHWLPVIACSPNGGAKTPPITCRLAI